MQLLGESHIAHTHTSTYVVVLDSEMWNLKLIKARKLVLCCERQDLKLTQACELGLDCLSRCRLSF